MKAQMQVVSPNGFAITLETPEMENRHALLEALSRFEDELIEAGYVPVETNRLASPGHSATPTSTDLAWFMVDSIAATVSDGKAYWRVKGGEFQKWGVIVYDEVLERAGLLAILNPLKPYSEPGMVAYYSLKENGKPKKIVRFERGK